MKSKFGKEDDVELDRKIQKLQRQIDKLFEQIQDVNKRRVAMYEQIMTRVEEVKASDAPF